MYVYEVKYSSVLLICICLFLGEIEFPIYGSRTGEYFQPFSVGKRTINLLSLSFSGIKSRIILCD